MWTCERSGAQAACRTPLPQAEPRLQQPRNDENRPLEQRCRYIFIPLTLSIPAYSACFLHPPHLSGSVTNTCGPPDRGLSRP